MSDGKISSVLLPTLCLRMSMYGRVLGHWTVSEWLVSKAGLGLTAHSASYGELKWLLSEEL
jgi:hypothetical protein